MAGKLPRTSSMVTGPFDWIASAVRWLPTAPTWSFYER
jgi:hypothetical protein